MGSLATPRSDGYNLPDRCLYILEEQQVQTGLQKPKLLPSLILYEFEILRGQCIHTTLHVTIVSTIDSEGCLNAAKYLPVIHSVAKRFLLLDTETSHPVLLLVRLRQPILPCYWSD